MPAEIREDLVGSLQKQIDVDEPEEDFVAAAPLAAPQMGDGAAPSEEMVEMSEDDILAALQSLEAVGSKDKGDRG